MTRTRAVLAGIVMLAALTVANGYLTVTHLRDVDRVAALNSALIEQNRALATRANQTAKHANKTAIATTRYLQGKQGLAGAAVAVPAVAVPDEAWSELCAGVAVVPDLLDLS